MRISEVSELTNTPASTIRAYEKWGVITPPQRQSNGYRVYEIYHVTQYFDTPDTYDLCTRVTKTATDKIFEGKMAWFELLQNLITAVTLFALVLNIAWYTLPCSLLTVLPMILLNHRKAKDMQKAEEERAYYDRKSTYAANLLLHKDSLMETKVFGSRAYIQKIWSDNLIQSMKRKREISLHAGKQGAVVNMVYTWAGLPVSFFVLWQVTK